MNPRTLRALLPAVREAREAGVLEIEAGEGKNRIRLKLAAPAPVAGEPIEPGTDVSAPDEDGYLDPTKVLEEHYRLHGSFANAPGVKGS